ncbi:hypothetical protein DPMN_087293 [Dreissena polymorpha]|uniref:Uncharacterized protein n=1 Tax=Dreissena polymorpha TaxID=45954 RepID=A0A9D4QVG6_DREPO|nr:hypothetical protein DPMN_087293 [Dreissena polymorpha]
MNFAAPSPHAFTALGTGHSASATLGLHGHALPLPLPPRHSFAIQELLGLNNHNSADRCRPSASTPSVSTDSFLSASAFLASSLSPSLALTSMAPGINSAAFPYFSWKSNLMSAFAGSGHGLFSFPPPPPAPPSSPGTELSKADFKSSGMLLKQLRLLQVIYMADTRTTGILLVPYRFHRRGLMVCAPPVCQSLRHTFLDPAIT